MPKRIYEVTYRLAGHQDPARVLIRMLDGYSLLDLQQIVSVRRGVPVGDVTIIHTEYKGKA